MKRTMALGLFLFGATLVGCAGKPTVNDRWDSTPKACDSFGASCTPLPQELPKASRVEAGFRQSPFGDKVQYYRLIQQKSDYLLLFIHGALCDSSSFRKQFARPVEGFDLAAFDRPGFGESSNKKEGIGLPFQARTAKAILDENPFLPIIVVGHSYGGAVAVQVASMYPERVRGLILINAILDPAQAKSFKAQRLLESAGVLPPTAKQTNRELMAIEEDLKKLVPKLAKLRMPIEMIVGDKDDVVDPANADFLAARFRNVGRAKQIHVEHCEECGHLMPDQNPDLINKAIERIKRRIEGA